jgi:spermidine/putrescine transport system permease protein
VTSAPAGSRTFLRVTLPLSAPGVAAAFIFVFVPTIGEFVSLSSSAARVATCSATRCRTSSTRALDWQTGSVLAFFLLLVVGILMALFGRFTQVRTVQT